ncbi:MAG: hypothetical protein V3V95_04995, partial [Thermodesulfobacteriota bacterium]
SHRANVCQRFLFPKPGIVEEVRVPSKIYDDDWIEFLDVTIKPGDEIKEITSHPCRAGSVIATGATREEARERAIEALNSIEIVIENN